MFLTSTIMKKITCLYFSILITDKEVLVKMNVEKAIFQVQSIAPTFTCDIPDEWRSRGSGTNSGQGELLFLHICFVWV